jgi:hypothetical protein
MRYTASPAGTHKVKFIFGGTTEIQKEVIGRSLGLLGLAVRRTSMPGASFDGDQDGDTAGWHLDLNVELALDLQADF